MSLLYLLIKKIIIGLQYYLEKPFTFNSFGKKKSWITFEI